MTVHSYRQIIHQISSMAGWHSRCTWRASDVKVVRNEKAALRLKQRRRFLHDRSPQTSLFFTAVNTHPISVCLLTSLNKRGHPHATHKLSHSLPSSTHEREKLARSPFAKLFALGKGAS